MATLSVQDSGVKAPPKQKVVYALSTNCGDRLVRQVIVHICMLRFFRSGQSPSATSAPIVYLQVADSSPGFFFWYPSYMQNFIAKSWLLIYCMPLVCLLLLFYVWSTTNPSTAGPMGVLFVFLLLYFFWASLLFTLIHLSSVVLGKSKIFRFLLSKSKHDGARFNWKSSYYIASIIAFVPVLLLALQSVNQLSPRDVLLVLLFTALAIFYVTRRT